MPAQPFRCAHQHGNMEHVSEFKQLPKTIKKNMSANVETFSVEIFFLFPYIFHLRGGGGEVLNVVTGYVCVGGGFD